MVVKKQSKIILGNLKGWQSLIAYLVVAMVVTSCAPLKPIEFRSVNNLSVKNLTTAPEISADLNLFNPNHVGGTVKEFNINIFLSETQLATIQLKNVRVASNSSFTLPLSTNASYNQIIKFLPSGISSFLNGKDIPVNITGTITIKKFLFRKTYPFTFHDSINSKDIQLK